MSDDVVWRLNAELERPVDVVRLLGGQPNAETRDGGLYLRVLDDEVAVTRERGELFAYAHSREAIEAAQDELAAALRRAGRETTIAIDRWDPATNAWQQIEGPPDRPPRRAGRESPEEIDLSEIGSRTRLLVLAVALAAAAAGVTWYALTPNVASYQLSTLLIMPLLIIVLVWLHHRLPPWLQWTAALLLAPIGPIGYLIDGGSQWWNWGQATPLPLVMLVLHKTIFSKDEGKHRQWYGGWVDGPWGPP